MITENVEVQTADGVSGGVIYRPQNSQTATGVIHLTDIRGIRPAHQDIAQHLCAEGYCVFMPNIFYRNGRPPIFETFDMKSDETRKRFQEITQPLTPEKLANDAKAYADFLASQSFVSKAPMGVYGYCFSGSFAMRTAAARPELIGAAASFHGGGLWKDTPESPHLLLPQIKAPLYFGYAVNDSSMSEDAIEKFTQALEDWKKNGGQYEAEVYQGALHGWTASDNVVYNQEQAEHAFEKLKTFLKGTLGPKAQN